MAVVSKDELMQQIKNLLGENTSDEAIKLLEDANDTLDAANKDNTAELTEQIDKLKKEKDDLDKEWRNKYRERFFNNDNIHNPAFNNDDDNDDDNDGDGAGDDEEPTQYDDLFSHE